MNKLVYFLCAASFCLFGIRTDFLSGAINKSAVQGKNWNGSQLVSGWKIRKILPVETLSPEQLDTAINLKGNGWYPVSGMPMMVHDILIENGIIDIPWLPGKAEACKWVSESDWLYTTSFSANQGERAFLNFKGMDVIVDIYLNGRYLASHSNMHLPLRIDITNKLKSTNNLIIHFHTTFLKDGERMIRKSEFKGMEVRHSTHNYGNYLGAVPYFCRIGVFDDILLEETNGAEISELVVDAALDKDLTTGRITIDASGILNKKGAILLAEIKDPCGKPVSQKEIPLNSVKNHFNLRTDLEIKSPELWWPRGYGNQPLYMVTIRLLIDNKPHQIISKKTGFRRITMPEHLHFMINGKRIWLWGACFVIPHWQTAVYDEQRVEQLLKMAAHANMNTLRTWADVEAPRDHFYECADSMGFLVWNDFPQLFQGTRLLDDNTPSENTHKRCLYEATYQIKKLKHHPSIFLWSGGNEEPLWNHEVFNGLVRKGPWPLEQIALEIGDICRQLDSSRVFLPSSPWNDTEPNDPATETHGYSHLWYVPGYDYLNFASEDTRISTPVLPSLRKFIAAEDLWPEDYSPLFIPGTKAPFPQTWRKYAGESSSYRKVGPVEQFYDAWNAASVVQRIGMASSLYYQQTIERQRHGRPPDDSSSYRRCGGYLVWKLNDSWPQIYSSKIDYFMEPLHPYYAIRRAFSPIHLSFEIGNYIWLWATNDTPQQIKGIVNIRLFHLDRNTDTKNIIREISLNPGESKVIVRLDKAGIGLFRREHILAATLTGTNGKIITNTVAFADIERHITFPDAKLNVKVNGKELEIMADKFARTITLAGNSDGDELGWFFDDNYFDLMPGEKKIVRILGKHSKGTIYIKPWYSSEGVTLKWSGK